jgi:membrane-associated phospholipid phosphatase
VRRPVRRAHDPNRSRREATTRPTVSTQTIAGLAIGIGAFVAGSGLARRSISGSEITAFRIVNGMPDRAYPAVWLPMQYGTFGTVPATSVIALARRRPRLALAIAFGGTTAWVLAKALKPIVDRGRPGSVLEAVSIRGVEEGDRGFPSGHAAVSTALTVVAWPYLSDRGRLSLAALSGFVPFARMYVGAHLPLDVVGGSALGLAIGCAVNLAIPTPKHVDRRANASIRDS